MFFHFDNFILHFLFIIFSSNNSQTSHQPSINSLYFRKYYLKIFRSEKKINSLSFKNFKKCFQVPIFKIRIHIFLYETFYFKTKKQKIFPNMH